MSKYPKLNLKNPTQTTAYAFLRPPRNFRTELLSNNALDRAGIEVLLKGEIHGPEAFAIHNGDLYTTVHGGYILRLQHDTRGNIRPIKVAKIGEPCTHFYEERKCGRPLGLDFDENGKLIVADAYYGIHRVNVKTGELRLGYLLSWVCRYLQVKNNID